MGLKSQELAMNNPPKTIQKFLEQYVYEPNVKTVFIDSSIWDHIPYALIEELQTECFHRKHHDWIGKGTMDECRRALAMAFNDKSKRITFFAPHGIVEFKRRDKQ